MSVRTYSYSATVPCSRCGGFNWIATYNTPGAGLCLDCRVKRKEDPKEQAVKEAEIVRVEVSGMLDFYRDEYRVTDQESLELAAAALVDLRTKGKEIESKRRRFTDPLSAAIKETRAAIDEAKTWFAPAEDLIKQCEDILKLKMSVHHGELREQNRIAIEEAAEAHAEGAPEGVTAALARVSPPPRTEGVSVGGRWDFELADIGRVPAEFLLLNGMKVREEMRAQIGTGRTPAIPGVRFLKRPIVAVRT